jgi:EAL domain-containing protein (putative c-di-GMP-specific phosphodiesterase class I)
MASHAPRPEGALGTLFTRSVGDAGVAHVMRIIRRQLGMDVAFVARFREADRVLEHVDADGPAPIHAGMTIPLHEGYCWKVVTGELPELIPDTAAVPAAMAIPATQAIPIGAHLSVPVTLENGDVYGTLCCFSHHANPTLGERDLGMLRAFAEVVAHRFDEDLAAHRNRQRASEAIWAAIAAGAPRIVYQPIYELDARALVGVECLSRFDIEPQRGPDQWFDGARAAGVELELELHAIRNALTAIDRFPAEVFLGINSSPALILSGRLAPQLAELDASRIVLEITEHATVTDYAALEAALRPMRARGVRIAVDDAGAGYASMRHILDLKCEMIKLDMSLTRGIDRDPGRRALARGLIGFAADIGSDITAEGIETRGELEVLRQLGVRKAQGYYLGKPGSLDDALRAYRHGCPALQPSEPTDPSERLAG